MALNMYSNVGFYKAPVCKSLMIYVGCSHAATHIPSLAPIFRKIFTESNGIESTKSLIRLIASKLIFPDSRSTILVCFLVYFFRILERRSGSLKFSSNLVTSWLLGLSLDLVLSPTLPHSWSPLLTPGPLYLVLPLFVPYYLHIPLQHNSTTGIISTKTMTYLLGLQLGLSSTSSLVSSLLCLLVGAAVHCTRSVLSSWRLPSFLGSMFSWIQSSPPPSSSQPMGATLEIQRTQHAEAVEQQLLRARARQFNVPIGGRQMRLDEMWGQNNPPNQPRQAVEPSPVMIQALTDMGFPRQRVEQALIRSNNDLDQATNLLLNDL